MSAAPAGATAEAARAAPTPCTGGQRPVNDMIPDQAPKMRLLTRGEVAALFRVDPKTVTRWAAMGLLKAVRTPGGQRRYRESEVLALLDETPEGVSA